MKKSDRFEKLVERSKGLAEAIRKKDSDLTPLLADQYNDPSHFVYEIIQNAEDAGAKNVTFELSNEKLRILHDGRDFDFEDIEDITGFGNSKKEGELNKIGEFGVGFKSVFAITETPHIRSGSYSIKIEDFVVPVSLGKSTSNEGTVIDLPFNHEQRSSKDVFDIIENRLKNIDTKSLLFLQSINEIEWHTPGDSGHYYKEEERVGDVEGARRVLSISQSSSGERLDEYLIFRKSGSESGARREEVAYKINEDEEERRTISSVPKSELVVFFPTKKDTYLDFLLQGPYKTTPNRENIPLRNEKNREIIEESADLVAESLLKIKDLGLLDVEFLKVLPTEEANESKNEIYRSVHRGVKESLQRRELLPTSTGGYVSASSALLAESEVLTELLDSEDIEILFSKSDWLDTGITRNKTPALWDYLRDQLGVEAVSFDSFARRITADFLERKSDQWMAQFYAQLRNQGRLWRKTERSVLRTEPIIRTAQGEHRPPFDEDETPHVFLPTEETSEYPTAKPSVIEDSRARAFLGEDLGLETPDLFSELHEHILPRYEPGNTGHAESDYSADLDKMVTACQDPGAAEKKKRLVRELRDLPFLKSVNPETGEQALRKPTEVYLGTDELREYFDGYEDAWFVSGELSEDFQDESFSSFLDRVGVAKCPRRISFEANLSNEKKYDMHGGDCTEEFKQTDFYIEGLDNFLKKDVNEKRSIILWDLISERYEEENSRSFFKGEYRWKFYQDKSARFNAKFYEALTKQPWIFDQEGNQKKPDQLAPSQMASGYETGDKGADFLLDQLLKSELEDRLPEERKRILEIADRYGVSHGELEKLLEREKTEEQASSEDEGPSGESSHGKSSYGESSNGESSQDEWSPDASPMEATPTVSEAEPQVVSRPDLGNQNSGNQSSPTTSRDPRNAVGKEEERTSGAGKQQPVPSSPNREIGRWGEKHVLETLRKKYEGKEIEVVWLNEGNDRGKGYDLALREDDRDKAYIEVKSKTRTNPEWVEVTRTQWEFARSLHGQEERSYWFYVVLGAGSKNPEIRKLENPIEQWRRGKRLAHPVNLKLT